MSIRRDANKFEDRLRDAYGPPQIIGTPDELPPEIPRMIFSSQHGFSQIVISQISVVLNVTYSPDWQLDISKGEQYLLDRCDKLFDLLKVAGEDAPFFSGLTTRVQIPCTNRRVPVYYLNKLLVSDDTNNSVFDLDVRKVQVVDEKYFSNVQLQNYRTWGLSPTPQDILQLSERTCVEQGIQIIGDFNDRYSFNEQRIYRSSLDASKGIIKRGIQVANLWVDKVKGLARD